MPPTSAPAKGTRAIPDHRRLQIAAAQVRLLYGNVNVGVAVTLIATATLCRLQWSTAAHPVIIGWGIYMFTVSVARFTLGRRYRLTVPSSLETGRWGVAFAAGAGLAGTGWGAAGVLLYTEAHFANQVLIVFIVGGMMLGAAATLAPRHEAFLAFIVPAGFVPAVRFLVQGDEGHIAMGLLAILFTGAILITTVRVHRTIVSSLNLQFENRDLVEDLQAANRRAEALNEHLEVRVQERTAELLQSAERLRAEITQREQMEEELLRARKLESLAVLAEASHTTLITFWRSSRGTSSWPRCS